MKIDVIIPNYNGADLIIKNLHSVLDSLAPYPGSKITIVDDGSDAPDYQKTLDFIEELKKKEKIPIELIRQERNSGFSSTVNTGALKSEADFLVLLNTDVAPNKNFLFPIFEDFAKNEKLFAVGCMDKSIEGEKEVLRGRGKASWSRGFLIHRKGEVDEKNTFWVSGGSSVIKTNLFKKFSGFDTIYDPFYWEDIDLSFRARKGGFEVMFEKRSVVTHRHLEGAIKKHFSSSKIKKIAYRNQFIFVWKNITDKKLLVSHFLFLPYYILMALVRFDLAFISGFLLAALRLPAIIKKRSSQKKLYTRSDNEIINNNTSI